MSEFRCTRPARHIEVKLAEYGCRLCDDYHTEGDDLYRPHLAFQGKHSYRLVGVYEGIVEAYHRAAARLDREGVK